MLLVSIHNVQATTLNEVSESLLQDIKTSQQRLNKREKDISKEKIALATSIRNEQQKLVKLREKTAVNRRLVDDNTLALTQIQDRLKSWRDQDNYQKRLLLELSEKLELPIDKINEVALDNKVGLKVLQAYVKSNQFALAPQWQEQKIVLLSGEIVLANVITLGPVNWYLLGDHQQGGLLDTDANVVLIFDELKIASLIKLFKSNQAQITFDPTLERALQLENQSESVYEHVERGGIWALPIILFALFALLIALLKAWQLWRLPELMPLIAERIDIIAKSNLVTEKIEALKLLQQQLSGAEQNLIKITLSTPTQVQRDDMLLAFLVENRQKLNARLGAIAITAAVSPLLGLLGTVSGMIETFQMMTIFGAGDPSVVSGGISKALITTELGLVVAIPSLILHALLTRKIKSYNTQLDTTAIRLGKMEINL
ncbi:MAG: MotA/TolQ/ExbB proton channel family protein [Colwellia sp.]|nr:MotA/TolQ/ExbB proton channel family protein [Colwellia sp.]